MEDFYYPEEKDRIYLLDKISRLAPEVGIDEDLLTLLDLAAHDSNAQIEQMAREIRDDLIRFRDNIPQPAEELISQLREIDTLHRDMSDLAPGSDEITTDEIPTLNDNDQHSSDKIAQKKHPLIGQLAELASNSEDFNQRDYALNHLMQTNHDAALEVIQHHLLTNDNAEERYLVIEKLSAAIGAWIQIVSV